jgi:hypothetical protein
MKQAKTLVWLLVAMFFFTNQAQAIVSTPNDAAWKKNLIKNLKPAQKVALAKFENKIQSLAADFAPAKIDLKDPVKKWLWYGLGLYLAAIVLSVLLGGVVSYLIWSAGSVCIVIWLLKYFGVI